MNKYLIVGLGNIGDDYTNTRHNIGFKIVDHLAKIKESTFSSERYADKTAIKIKGIILIIIKPNTYMNLSGKAVRYWMEKENISPDNTLIITDDIHINFGMFRLKPKGSDGGHNGLKSIQELINTNQYPRLRVGVGGAFGKGQQVQYVLSEWSTQENDAINTILLDKSYECIQSFVLSGIERTMNQYNKQFIES